MADHVIEIKDFTFNAPSGEPVVVEVGDTVRWVNLDPPPHRHNAVREEAPTFATRILAQNETSDPVAFDQATGADGIEYFCTPHPFMTGKIVVTARGSDKSYFTKQAAQRASSQE